LRNRRAGTGQLLCWFIIAWCSFFSLPADGAEPFADQLTALAAKCDELGLKEQAEVTRRWNVPRHLGRQYLFLPVATDPAVPRAGAPTVVRQWYERFSAIRRERGAALFGEAKTACDQGKAAYAYQLLHEVLREDPEHAEARRILGYVKSSGGLWMLPDAERMVAQPARTDHPKLGWRARAYWRLEAPHFQIATNHSVREAQEAGRQLEDLHALWRQIFFRYWSTPEALAARFAGGNEPLAPERPKMQVAICKTREEYEAQLPDVPQAAITLGIYLNQQKTAFFFAGDTSVYPTWYHEATHQLFQESLPRLIEEPGRERNFWAVEGAALYMESLVQRDGWWSGGGCEAERLQFARRNAATAGDRQLPIERLAGLSREAVQTSPDIRQLYAQAAGLAHFLIDGEGGRHREGFVDLLAAIYRGEDAGDALAKSTGESLGSLDGKYRAFLNVTDADLAGVVAPERVRYLWFGGASVSDKGLAHLAGCKNLQWIDLSLTAVTDEGLKHLSAASGLKQLFLEGSKVTDASLAMIAGFKQLEELDLSKLSISDNGLAAIAGMRSVKVLHLTGSPVTDAGLEHLRGLKQLERLEAEGTQVTAEGLGRLRAALPKLKGT
jgi:hypothetical protein